MKPAITIVITEVILPDDDVYFSAFNAETGEKIAPWADADTADQVMTLLLSGKAPE